MTVLDTSAVYDFLLEEGVAREVGAILDAEETAAAPELLVYEVSGLLRRDVRHGILRPERAAMAVEDLGDLAVDLFPTLPLRGRVWELRENLSVGDAFFVALAELLEEPLATKDSGLARAAQKHSGARALHLPG